MEERQSCMCIFKAQQWKGQSREDHGASPSLWKEYYLKTGQTIQVGSGKINTTREKKF
jgi:hypothetical protein